MDYTNVAAALQNQWNLWNIRGFMILSLCMQLLLAIVTPFRRKSSNHFIVFAFWSGYLLADWAAMYVFGLISNAGCRNSENCEAQVPPDVLAFWAAFLLVHLGGPDTVTTFSLEDNSLWMRHLVGLIAQLSVFLYIFMRTLSNNTLLVPTILISVAGVINYGERTRATYLTRLDNLKKNTEKPTEYVESEDIYIFRVILKGLLVNIKPSLQECTMSRIIIFTSDPEFMLRMILAELESHYELLYTKIKAANSTWGRIARTITFYSTLVAFILFRIGHKLHQIHGGDLIITYALFAGVFVLHAANMATSMRSLHPDCSLKEIILFFLENGIFLPLVLNASDIILSYFFAACSVFDRFQVRGWSNKIEYFNILSYCFKQSTLKKCRKLGSIWNKLAEDRHVSKEDIDISLWSSVWKAIGENAREANDPERMKILYEARGDLALGRIGCDKLMPYIKNFQYEDTLLIWHIATQICINIEEGEHYIDNDDSKKKRIFSKKLSDYMMYLLVMQPKLMPTVAGINYNRYKDTCTELEELRKKLKDPTMQGFCELILREHLNTSKPAIEENNHAITIEPDISDPDIEENNHGISVLKESCRLAELLREENNMWEVIFMVWVELLSFAAGHCRVDSHIQLLSEGSEFITSISLYSIRAAKMVCKK